MRIGRTGLFSRPLGVSFGTQTAAGFVELRHELAMLEESFEPLLRRQSLGRRDQFLAELLGKLRFHSINNRDWSERRDLPIPRVFQGNLYKSRTKPLGTSRAA
jgi:hypothetical protein